jgi:hypothetical protein
MKVKVIETFRDKNDHVTMYEKGVILDVQDEKRAQSLIDRNLAKEFKGNQKASVVLSEKQENPEAGKGDE